MTVRLTVGDIAVRLQEEGLASPDDVAALRTAAAQTDDGVPWYVRVAAGAAAWAATAFLLAFLFGLRILDSDGTRIVAGLVLIATALGVRRAASAEFMRQGAVAMSLAGQALIIAGTGELTSSIVLAGVVGVALSLAMIVLMPDRVHRFLSTLIAAGSTAVALHDPGWQHALDAMAIGLALFSAAVWRIGVRQRSVRAGEILEPVGYALLVALFAILLFPSAVRGSLSVFDTATGMPTVLVMAALLCALVVAVVREHGRATGDPATLTILVAIVLLAILTRTSPGILAGLAVLVLGFDRRSPVLIGMAALFLTVFGSVYYYSLSLTLIEKAGVLAASGAVLLAARAAISRAGPRPADAAGSAG